MINQYEDVRSVFRPLLFPLSLLSFFFLVLPLFSFPLYEYDPRERLFPICFIQKETNGILLPALEDLRKRQKKDPAFSDGILSDAEKIKNSGLANGAFQFVISGFCNKFREIRSVVVFRADRIAFLDAFAGLSLVNDLGAFFVINFDVFSFFDVVEFHSRFSLVWLTVTHRVYQTW